MMPMRTETEMLRCITSFAEKDARVLAVYMNGSRANPNAEKDPYRDFDVVFVVTEIASFLSDRSWLHELGEIAIMQEPDAMDAALGKRVDFKVAYSFLMLFADGNRIDLHLESEAEAMKTYGQDSLTVPLMDKAGILPAISDSCDRDYWIKRPDKARFHACCNEFWWCLNNVAKGLVRGQMPYVMRMLYEIVLPELARMTEWRIGSEHGFSVTSGKWGKYFAKYLPEADYELFIAAYAKAEGAAVWDSISAMTRLFSCQARLTAKRIGFCYNESEERGASDYLAAMKDEWIS